MSGLPKYPDEYWEKRFEFMSNQPPERVKQAIRRVYNCYPVECMPQGLCDPMYIMNVLAVELGIGDGQGNFNLPESDQ